MSRVWLDRQDYLILLGLAVTAGADELTGPERIELVLDISARTTTVPDVGPVQTGAWCEARDPQRPSLTCTLPLGHAPHTTPVGNYDHFDSRFFTGWNNEPGEQTVCGDE